MNPLQKFVEGEVELERLKQDQRENRQMLIEWAIREGRHDLFSLDLTRVFRDAGFNGKRDAVNNMNIGKK